MMLMFLLSGAHRPYFLYSGKNSVYIKPFFSAYSFAQLSIPLAPPEMISVTPFGKYHLRLCTVKFLEPTIAIFIFHLKNYASL